MTDKPQTTEHPGHYDVVIRRNADGVQRTRRIDWDWYWGPQDKIDGEPRRNPCGDLYWWTEGNFGCDCNREWEFQRAGGEEISDEPVCGSSRYTVIKVILPDGEEIPVDEREVVNA